MTEELVINETESFHQLSTIETQLSDLGYFVEIDSQSITLYKEAWEEKRSNLPSLGLLKMRTQLEEPYYLFGMDLLQSRYYKNLKTAVENLIIEARKKY